MGVSGQQGVQPCWLGGRAAWLVVPVEWIHHARGTDGKAFSTVRAFSDVPGGSCGAEQPLVEGGCVRSHALHPREVARARSGTLQTVIAVTPNRYRAEGGPKRTRECFLGQAAAVADRCGP